MSSSIVETEQPMAGAGTASQTISVVVPVAERHDDLGELYRTHADVLRRLGRPFEFIFVLDGGFHRAGRQLEPLRAAGEPIRLLTLPRRFGEATALVLGFEQARGAVLVTLSSYFQVEPEGLVTVLDALEKGADVVIARRFPRLDSWINRIQTYGFHVLIAWLTGVRLHDVGCGVRGLRREVVREIHLYGDLHRFIPMLAHQRGFVVAEARVPQHPAEGRMRVYRPSVYLHRLLDLVTLMFLVKFTRKPLRFFGLVGAGVFGLGSAISLVLAVERLVGLTALADRPLLILGVLLMVLGVQVASIGLLGELIIFTHARKMKDYAIETILR